MRVSIELELIWIFTGISVLLRRFPEHSNAVRIGGLVRDMVALGEFEEEYEKIRNF